MVARQTPSVAATSATVSRRSGRVFSARRAGRGDTRGTRNPDPGSGTASPTLASTGSAGAVSPVMPRGWRTGAKPGEELPGVANSPLPLGVQVVAGSNPVGPDQ